MVVKFPGYEFKKGVSTYKGEVVGEGGYVYSEPGVHRDVVLLDVASMHPSSIEALNLFGPYTERFSEIKQARIAIKHGDKETARHLLDGALVPYLEKGDPEQLESLQMALKIVINSVYGLTTSKFPTRFRDLRNVDNIVAKRGALFMVDLKHMVQEEGFNVAHIKTDSIKIPHGDADIIDKVTKMGKDYGYDFEHEATYRVMALVDKANYIAAVENGDGTTHWSVTGALFAHPYVYSTLFTDEKVGLSELAEAKSVAKGYIYLEDENYGVDRESKIEDMHFMGKTGKFLPVLPGVHGGKLWRIMDGKKFAVTGTSGHLWMEAHKVSSPEDVDWKYYDILANTALENIEKVGSYVELMHNSGQPPTEFLRKFMDHAV